ncbi:uncharacterized protein LOC131526057 [Onychostoma macrolepis]|uniref:uncharacterized protein LOC131526057 n=1 Tax=Onychostoma macrolepis TaxID=369639 RepID=UPI00272AC4DA|nr:uncharacterized protein LOC131526057 [Onychostoma macrolepis]
MGDLVILLLTLFPGLCIADLTENLAAGAEAVQSSTYSHLGAAQNAVDGNTESNYVLGSCTHTAWDDPWWRADLKEVHKVTRVIITNRGDCCEERIVGAQIRIGKSLENNGNNNELVTTVGFIPPGGTKTFDFKPVEGQYVNIFLPGHGKYLTLCEVQVFAAKTTSECPLVLKNLAAGAEAVQSSTYNHLGAAQNAVDGNTESNYMLGSCTHTAGDDPWWRADLKEVHKVTKIIITNRGDCCEERIVGAQIRIGKSLENNGNNNELVTTVGFIPPGGTKTFDFKPVEGRYVNIFLPGHGKYLTLCEVQVFAAKTTSECPLVLKNLAAGAEAVQSSTYNHLGAAQNAVDGNTESNYMLGSCTHTAGDDPWWRADLKEVHKVTKIIITNRGDCCEERIVGAQIRIGKSLENNGNNNELVTTVGFIPPGGTKTFDFKPVEGRYVNIFLPGHGKYLTLCEVQVFTAKKTSECPFVLKNLAAGAEVVQSSTYNHLGAAQNAVDGNTESNYMLGSCTHTAGDDPWWRADLKEVHKVTRVIITNRGDCCEERIVGAQIRIGKSLENNGNNNELVTTVGFIPPGGTKTFDFKPVEGRYVNIFLPGHGKYLTLCEVEVFAD